MLSIRPWNFIQYPLIGIFLSNTRNKSISQRITFIAYRIIRNIHTAFLQSKSQGNRMVNNNRITVPRYAGRTFSRINYLFKSTIPDNVNWHLYQVTISDILSRNQYLII